MNNSDIPAEIVEAGNMVHKYICDNDILKQDHSSWYFLVNCRDQYEEQNKPLCLRTLERVFDVLAQRRQSAADVRNDAPYEGLSIAMIKVDNMIAEAKKEAIRVT